MYYHYEVYTKNPDTDETGWDIETGWAKANSMLHAKAKVKNVIANFDCFIQIYPANMNANDILTVE